MSECLLSIIFFPSTSQSDKKSQDQKPAIEENAFDALERDFQEVIRNMVLDSFRFSIYFYKWTNLYPWGTIRDTISSNYRFLGNSWAIRALRNFVSSMRSFTELLRSHTKARKGLCKNVESWMQKLLRTLLKFRLH